MLSEHKVGTPDYVVVLQQCSWEGGWSSLGSHRFWNFLHPESQNVMCRFRRKYENNNNLRSIKAFFLNI